MDELMDDDVGKDDEIIEILSLDDNNGAIDDLESIDSEYSENNYNSDDQKEWVDENGDQITIKNVHKNSSSLCLTLLETNNGNMLVSGGQDDKVAIIDMETLEIIDTISGHRDSVISLEFNQKLGLLMSADMSGLIIFRDINSFQNISTSIETDELEWVNWFEQNSDSIICGLKNSMIQIWRITDKNCKTYVQPFQVSLNNSYEDEFDQTIFQAVIISRINLPQYKFHIIASYPNGKTCIWDLKSTKVTENFDGIPDAPIISLAYQNNGQLFATGYSNNCIISLYSVSGKILQPMLFDKSLILNHQFYNTETLTFHDDGYTLLSGHTLIDGNSLMEGIIGVWDIPSHKIRSHCMLNRGINMIRILDKYNSIAASLNGTLHIFDYRLCNVKISINIFHTFINEIIFNQENKIIFCCSNDGSVAKLNISLEDI